MTTDQKQQIINYKNEGFTYAEIIVNELEQTKRTKNLMLFLVFFYLL